MLFNLKAKTQKTSRAEVFSKIAAAKRNGRTSLHIDTQIPIELRDELSLQGYSAYSSPGFSGTNVYWKNS